MSNADTRALLIQIPGILLAIPTGGLSLVASIAVAGIDGCAKNEREREHSTQTRSYRYATSKKYR